MKAKKTNKNCSNIKDRFYKTISKRVGLEAGWVQNHIAGCPKCQRRLASLGRVNLALSMIKSMPHGTDLLGKANSQAIGVLKHSLRNCSKAEKLRKILPNPTVFEKCWTYRNTAANSAACIAILCLMKVGIFSSASKLQAESQKIVKQYYEQAGKDLADDIFSA